MEFKDYYKTLGVTKSSSAGEIKKAFRKLARKYHPDVNPGDQSAEARFKEINEAYEVLGDADKRKKYDELGANWRMYEQGGPQGSPFGAGSPFGSGGRPGGGGIHWDVSFGSDPNSGFRRMSEDEVRETFGDNPFSDFFQTFFAGGGSGFSGAGGAGGFGSGRAGGAGFGGRPPGPQTMRGRDMEHTLEIGLEQAFHGMRQRLSIDTGGKTRTVDVRIPAGVTDGSRVRVTGEGEPGSGGGAAGDIYLRIRLAPHPRFEVKGRDLYLKTPVPVTTAVLGGHVDVTTVDGQTVRLKVPAATQSGQVMRVKGKGLPGVGGKGSPGDLYARIQITVPTELTAEERKHYEALAELEQRLSKHKSPVA